MNRRQRRASKDRFVAKCQACATDHCVVHTFMRHGEKDLGICKGCPCAVGTCDACGCTGEHWLGCSVVGIPEAPAEGTVVQ